MKRIAIIGCAGSGKSTLALKLHNILKLPLFHIDKYFWQPGWKKTEFEKYQKIHKNLCDKSEWIIDGMNLKLLDYRLERADTVIFLDVNRYICFLRVFKRFLFNYNKEMFDRPFGCHEKLDIKFLKWIWNFKKNYRPSILEKLKLLPKDKKILPDCEKKLVIKGI